MTKGSSTWIYEKEEEGIDVPNSPETGVGVDSFTCNNSISISREASTGVALLLSPSSCMYSSSICRILVV